PHPGGRSRSRFGAAAQAGTESGFSSRCRRSVILNVRTLAGWRWAHRTAVDARRGYSNEEFAIETRVAAEARPLECLSFEAKNCYVRGCHGGHDTCPPPRQLAVFGRGRPDEVA